MEKKEIVIFRQDKANQVYQADRKGDQAKCSSTSLLDETTRKAYCEDKVKVFNVYKYVDCLYGSSTDFCFLSADLDFAFELSRLLASPLKRCT